MGYKGRHTESAQNAQKRAKAETAAKSAKQDVYTVNGIPVVPVRFTGFSRYQANPTDTTTSAN